MGELISKEIDRVLEQATPVTVVMSLTMILLESARIMDAGLGRHQHVNAEVCMHWYNIVLLWEQTSLLSSVKSLFQLNALLCLIHQMGKLISKAIDLETEQATPATAAMSYRVTLLGFAKLMVGGLEVHQLVNVKVSRRLK